MTDRQPTPGKEGRVRLTFDDGTVKYARVEMADDPLEVGDPLNKATFWPDDVAALFGLGADSLPKDGFEAIYNQSFFHIFESYIGDGKFGKDNPVKFQTEGPPVFVFVSTVALDTKDTERLAFLPPLSSVGSTVIYGGSSEFLKNNGSTECNYVKVTVSGSNKTVEWYSEDNAAAQLNRDGELYWCLILCAGRW